MSNELDEITESLLLYIIDNNIKEIIPKFSFQLGFFYPEMMKIAAKLKKTEQELLNILVEKGYAERKTYKKYVSCPTCKSYRLLIQFKCPHCGSTNVNKVTLVSHIPCGYIGVLEEMEQKNSKKICPKCGKEIGKKGKDWIHIGSLYKCIDCGELFEMPVSTFICINCNKVFDHKEAEYKNIYIYTINLEKIKSFSKNLIINSIITELKKNNIPFELNPTLQGLSGLEHKATLVVKKDGKPIIIDVLDEGEMDNIMSIYGKIIDLGKPEHIVVLPKNASESRTIDESLLKIVTYDKASEAPKIVIERIKSYESK